MKKLGGKQEVLAKLNSVAQELSVRLTDFLQKEYGDYEEIKNFSYVSQFGLSSPVRGNRDEDRILADIQALQAAKMAKLDNKPGLNFDQEMFDKLMKEAEIAELDLDVHSNDSLSEDELKEVRGKTETELALKVGSNNKIIVKQRLLKRYLDILDLLDYQKSWSADPRVRTEEKEAILGILKGLEEVLKGKENNTDFNVASILKKALGIIMTNSKDARITSGEVFFTKAVKSLMNENGRLIAMDVVGFWRIIQNDLAKAHRDYIKSIGEESVMLALVLKADDIIKHKIKETVLFDTVLSPFMGVMSFFFF